MIPQIFFATHNINGIRLDQTKLDRILIFSAEHNIDVIVLTETNLLASTKRFINITTKKYGYVSHWAESSDKIKGSGVGILIAEHLANFIHKIDCTSVPHYVIKASLCFKGCYLQIYGIYNPPTDRPMQQAILKYIKQEHLVNKSHSYYHTVILGDFNSIVDSSLDKSGNTRFYKQPSTLINFLQNNLYIDTFRFLHQYTKAYTWRAHRHTHTIASRIDHIWVSNNWVADITFTSIENTDNVTGSDHHLVTCLLHTGDKIRNFNVASRRRRDKPRLVYDYKSATTNDWENYRALSNTIFANDRILLADLYKDSPLQPNVDLMWKSIAFNISETAIKTIPHKQIPYRRPKKPTKLLDIRPSGLLAHHESLRRIIRDIESNPDPTYFTKIEINDYNNRIATINSDMDLTIPHILQTDLANWLHMGKPNLNLIRKIIKVEALKAKEEAISQRLIQRAEDTVTNQSRMLSSILDRDFRRIVVDRIVTVDSNNIPTLHTNPDDILKIAPTQFRALTHPRQHKFDDITPEWASIYSPLQHVHDDIYQSLMDPPTFIEWQDALNKCSLNTAPGMSGITYLLIKRLHPTVHELLRSFAGILYSTALIPTEWKTSQIFPIPKPTDWEFNLEKTRPIILLECLRKLTVRVINTRIACLCLEHNILRGPNFGGLPGGHTKTPIHTLQNVMEDAKNNKKALWIAFQDMSKAFDSVGMVPLRHALARIRLPPLAIDFLINLFQHRKMKVITKFGLSDELQAMNGIDQGEVISPLIWRIFYDPLLCRISEDASLGYTMTVDWPTDLQGNTHAYNSRISALAFYDDTSWLARSRAAMAKTIDISNEFFVLNDININGAKSELIIINGDAADNPSDGIIMGTDNATVLPSPNHKPVRYLGVWFTPSLSKPQQERIAKKEIKTIASVIRTKKLTVDQMVYINNKVLIPRLEYRLCTTLFSVMTARNLYTPITKVAKQLAGLPGTAKVNILAHPGMVGFITLEMNQLTHHFTEFNIRLNETSLASETTLLRLRKFQLDHKITSPIWSLEFPTLSKLNYRDNFSATVLYRMSSLDLNLQYSRDNLEWSIPGYSPEITSFFLDAPDLPHEVLHSFWSSKHRTYRLGQCSHDNGPIPWSMVKAYQGLSKQGRTPIWFTWLSSILQQLPTIPSELTTSHIQPPSTDRRRKEWVSFTASSNTALIGRITSKSKFAHLLSITHWTARNSDYSYSICNGCEYSSWKSENNDCIIQKPKLLTTNIPDRLLSLNKNTGILTTVPTQQSVILSSELPLLLPTIAVDTIDTQLIKSALADNSARNLLLDKLIDITNNLPSDLYQQLIDIYTDGSLNLSKVSADNAAIMGSGWYIPSLDVQYGCASTGWPSSTKAEFDKIRQMFLQVWIQN